MRSSRGLDRLNDNAKDAIVHGSIPAGGYKEMLSTFADNIALVIEPKCRGRGELRGLSQ